jgi:DNA-binding MarR family transcriptional regulator
VNSSSIELLTIETNYYKQIADMDDTTLDRTASNLLALLFFHHKQILKSNEEITGVLGAQLRVLGLLMKEGTMSMSSLGNQLLVSKPYMTNLVDALIKDGFVERNPDIKDRRVINITITKNGIRHVENALDLYKTYMKGILSELDSRDLENLCSSAEKVVVILSKIAR